MCLQACDMQLSEDRDTVCSVYYKSRNVRYFSSLIAKVTTAKGHHQELFREKKRERVNKSSKIKWNRINSCENFLKVL